MLSNRVIYPRDTLLSISPLLYITLLLIYPTLLLSSTLSITLFVFNLLLYIQLYSIYINQVLEGVYRLQFRYRVSRIRFFLNLLNLYNLLLFIYLIEVYYINYKSLFLYSSELYKVLIQGFRVYINDQQQINLQSSINYRFNYSAYIEAIYYTI